jgi:hypothetical protein
MLQSDKPLVGEDETKVGVKTWFWLAFVYICIYSSQLLEILSLY